MINYNKVKIKEALNLEDIFTLLTEFGGEPEYTNFGIISTTICHNPPGVGSRKLYYYINSTMFTCYTGCNGSFDIFELICKVAKIQWQEEYDLNAAVRWVARRFGISGDFVDGADEDALPDWKIFANYDKLKEINKSYNLQELPEYNSNILSIFNYKVKIEPWLKEGITQEVIEKAQIGYYPGKDQITIPHFDQAGRFIGLRGRTLIKEDAEIYGKYRPITINHKLYNHPLGLNLYSLNWSKENIKAIKKVIIFESEKSCLKYASYFGWENNLSVAVCGSNLSVHQMQLLLNYNVEEIIIAFDKQFQELNTDESKLWEKKLTNIYDKYHNDVLITFMWDKWNLLGYKDSPIDCGMDNFLYLFKNRIII